MNFFKSVLLSVACTLFFPACGSDLYPYSPRLDASSEKAMETSEKNIAKSLSEDEREKFVEAMETIRDGAEFYVAAKLITDAIGASFDNPVSALWRIGENEEKLSEQTQMNLRNRLHGKTVPEIIQMAEQTKGWILDVGSCITDNEKFMCNGGKGIENKMPDFYRLPKE